LLKKPTFALDSPDLYSTSHKPTQTKNPENTRKNHEIVVREWFCDVLTSRKLTSRETAVFSLLYKTSQGLRWEVKLRRNQIAESLDLSPRNVSAAIRSLEDKNLILTATRTTSAGDRNYYYLSMTYPEHFNVTDYVFSESNFPKSWKNLYQVAYDASIGVEIDTDYCIRRGEWVSKMTPRGCQQRHLPPVKNDTHTGCQTPMVMGLDAPPSSFRIVFLELYRNLVDQRLAYKYQKAAVHKGIDKLTEKWGEEVIEERLAMLYADKGETVVKPNFHEYLATNLNIYDTEQSKLARDRTQRRLERLASETFLSIHEGFHTAYREGSDYRPNFEPHIESLIRVLGLNMQFQYERFKKNAANPGVMRGIENLFTYNMLSYYKTRRRRKENGTTGLHREKKETVGQGQERRKQSKGPHSKA